MKSLLTILVVLFCLPTFAVISNPTQSSAFDNTGSVKFQDIEWVNVKNVSGGSLAVGIVVVVDTTEDDGISVTTSTAEEDVPYCMLMDALADDAEGRCQVYGYTDAILFDASAASAVAGKPGYLSDGVAGSIEYVVPATAGSGGFQPFGVFLDASAATAAVEFFINP